MRTGTKNCAHFYRLTQRKFYVALPKQLAEPHREVQWESVCIIVEDCAEHKMSQGYGKTPIRRHLKPKGSCEARIMQQSFVVTTFQY